MDGLKRLYRYLQYYRPVLAISVISLIMAELVGLLPPWLLKLFLDYVGNPASRADVDPWQLTLCGVTVQPMAACAGVFVAVAAVQAGLRYCWRKHLHSLPRNIQCQLREDCFRHLQKLDKAFFQKRQIGDIMSRFTNDIQNIDDVFVSGIALIVDVGLVIPASFVLLILISVKLTIVSLLPLAAVALVFLWFKRKIHHGAAAVQEQLGAMYSLIQETVANVRVIQAYAREPWAIDKFAQQNDELLRKKMALLLVAEGFTPVMVLANGLTIVLTIWLGGREVMQGNLTVGGYMAFIGYLAILTYAVANIGYTLNASQQAVAGMERVEEVLASEARVGAPDVNDTRRRTGVPCEGLGQRGTAQGMAIKDLTFAYEGKQILRGVNLSVAAGSCVGITGPLGAGKSTLLQLLARIYEPPFATVFVGGVDVRQMPIGALHEMIGFVEQEPFLFAATLRENIAFGLRDAAEGDLTAAVAAAGLEQEFAAFPCGLDTLVGERGVTLSGGQRQRVALARAIIKKPAILLLDNAFSNLDAETEQRVFATIRQALRDTTIIFVSQRVSVLQLADVIAIMEAGAIVETGTHAELIIKSRIYHGLYKRQCLDEKELIEE